MQKLDRHAYPASPWKNGGGVTRQVLISPQGASLDDFDFRISIADVGSDGPFSRFDSVDRHLLVLSGAGIALETPQGEIRLDCASAPYAFAGETPIRSRLPDGPITDFNVMTRRGRATQTVRQFQLHGQLTLKGDGLPWLLLLAEGQALQARNAHGQTASLSRLDALLLTNPDELTLNGNGCRVIVAELKPATAPNGDAA